MIDFRLPDPVHLYTFSDVSRSLPCLNCRYISLTWIINYRLFIMNLTWILSWISVAQFPLYLPFCRNLIHFPTLQIPWLQTSTWVIVYRCHSNLLRYGICVHMYLYSLFVMNFLYFYIYIVIPSLHA